MAAPPDSIYDFGALRLDTRARQLLSENTPVALTPKSFELLRLLVENSGRALSKSEILESLWPDIQVEDGNLSFQVSVLRKALGPEAGTWIETVPRYGYRWNARRESPRMNDKPGVPIPGGELSPEDKQRQIAKILESKTFQHAPMLRCLLEYLGAQTIGGNADRLKEYVIGVEAFRRPQSFDPGTDTIVRVQAKRLRSKLRGYRESDGRDDSIVVEVPVGQYAVTFEKRARDSVAPSRAPCRRFTVGRQKELAELGAAFRSASEGAGLVLCVAGEAGIGKSTLLDDFSIQLRSQGVDYYFANGRCSERLAGSEAYLPLLEALENLLRGGGEPVAQLLKLVAPTWYVQIVPHGSHEAPDSRVLADVKAASQERLKRELVAFLEAVSRLNPLVLFLDDMHWADASTADLMSYAGSRIVAMRVLVVATYRPSELQLAGHPFLQVRRELQAHGACRELALGFLSSGDIQKYLALQFPEHSFPADVAPSIHARTEGNALFMVDLVRYLRDCGVIAKVDGRWTLAQSLPEIKREIPESTRSMIQRKVDQLDEPARRLAAAAAVQGYEFDSATVAKALVIDPAEVEERLGALDRLHGLVRWVGEKEFPDATLTQRYSFVHVLYQNALEFSLAATRKASLSGAIARAVMGFYAERSAEVASELALLLHDARDFARASDYFLGAAGNAARVYAYPEAVALCQRAVADAERLSGPERHSRVLAAALEMGPVYRDMTRFDDAIAAFDLAERSACESADRDAQINAICGKAAVLFFCKKRATEAEEQGERALELARLAGSNIAVASSEFILACTRWCKGEVAEAEAMFDRAIPVLRRSGPPLLTVTAVSFRGSIHAMLSEYDDAERALDWAESRAQELAASLNDRMRSLLHKGRILGNRGRISDARNLLDEAAHLAERAGDRRWRPRLGNTQAWLLCEAQDPEAALRLDLEAAQMAREFGDAESECNSHINAARDYLALGEPARALEHLRRGEQVISTDFWFRWVYHPRLQGELASYWIAQGDLKQAGLHAAVSLEGKSPKRRAWARKLQGDIAVLEDRIEDAGREYDAALRLTDQFPCPTIEWRILRAAAELAGRRRDASTRDALRARARAVVASLALSVREESLRKTMLSSKAIREL